jgi:hypothetical protein
MRTADDFLLDLSESPERLLAASAGRVFDAAWRVDFSAPGFCLIHLGRGVGSLDLRSLMLVLKGHLDGVAADRGVTPFRYRSMGRFDQQETTKFHLDGAPERSLLMLGYEPSVVRSRLSLADYARCAYDLGIEPRRFLDEFNPMCRKGEELLSRYVTELPQPGEGHSRILLINNSRLPFSEARTNPLGVLHKAEIIDPDESERRVVNSIMLAVGGPEEIGDEAVRAFVATEEISQKLYG